MPSSDKQSVVKRPKGNPLSTFLVVAAVAAAGGVGHFLWKFQARLNDGAAAGTTAAVAARSMPEPEAQLDPDNKVVRALNELQAPRVQNAPRPAAADGLALGAPIPIVSGGKSVRGGISIVGKNGAVSGVAPATPADLRGRDDYYAPSSGSPGDGPKIYTSRDPNLDLPLPSHRSGRPRYYDFESGRSRASDYNGSSQRSTSVRQGTTSGGN